ncbi:MAG: response regulator transcription factor [Acidobacteriota bacterium]|nr:response regulator transcription factor [Acidobacteriota bacterium]
MARLLVVDDEPGVLQAVTAILRDEEHMVTTARSGAEALASVATMLPDLIVSDIRMPGMSGYALAFKLRAVTRTKLIPIVFLTAKGATADRIASFRAGVDAFITKPFEPDELVAVVANILGRIERTHTEIAKVVGSSNSADEITIADEELTDSELRVALAVARGLSNKEIAVELGLSIRTIENHFSHIYVKKGFTNRVEIARYVFEREQKS